MYPPEFEYFAPNSIEEAVEALSAEDAKVLAGGQSLLPLLKSRFASFGKLVDISRIIGLDYVKVEGESMHIGPMTTIASLESNGDIQRFQPLISEAASQIADPLVRNMGTIGGNVSHSDPANDMPPVMLALNAKFTAISKSGERIIDAEKFFVDSFQTALEHGEILKGIEVPVRKAGQGYSYMKLKKGSADFSVAAVACVLDVSGKTIKRARIALASVAAKAEIADDACKHLEGKEFSESLAEEAGVIAAKNADPQSDSYGSEDYKRRALGMLVKDSIIKAYIRGGGSI